MQKVTTGMRDKWINNMAWAAGKNGEGNNTLGTEKFENIDTLNITLITLLISRSKDL